MCQQYLANGKNTLLLNQVLTINTNITLNKTNIKQKRLVKELHNEEQTSLLSIWCAVHKKLYIPGLGST